MEKSKKIYIFQMYLTKQCFGITSRIFPGVTLPSSGKTTFLSRGREAGFKVDIRVGDLVL